MGYTQDLWFVDFPKQTDLKKGSLVRVQARAVKRLFLASVFDETVLHGQERQKGTVVAISADEPRPQL